MPQTDGNETEGPHPCVVIAIHEQTNLCSVVPVTSTPTAGNFPYSLQIPMSARNGLYYNSVAMAFQVTCIDIDKLEPRMGTLEPELYQQICTLVKKYLRL